MKAITLFILLGFGLAVFAQNNEVEISGAIEFDYDNEIYKNKIITNERTGATTTTNILGQFKIMAQEGDILKVSGFNIHEKEVPITANHIASSVILILVEPQEITLSEVEANRFRFTGNLDIDVRNAKQIDTLEEAIKKMGLPIGKVVDPMARYTSPIWKGLSLDLDGLYDAISGERRRKLAEYNFNQSVATVSLVREYFTDEYFINFLNIPSEEIDSFIITVMQYEPLQEAMDHNAYYDIIDAFKYYAPIYNQRVKLRDGGKGPLKMN